MQQRQTHRPRKRFGQNFLQDKAIITAILHALSLTRDDKVVEIGPGLGALTKPLLAQLNHLLVIEIDRDLHQRLMAREDPQHLTAICADALTLDFSQWGKNLRIVGNLPYNISTPLLFHLLKYKPYLRDLHVMLQKEVVDRMIAKPRTKAYGRLSLMMQYHFKLEPLFEVDPQAFYPQPKVRSAVLRLIPHTTAPYPLKSEKDFSLLLAQAFSMRRKTLANNLKLSKERLESLGLNPLARPEELSLENYVALANVLKGA